VVKTSFRNVITATVKESVVDFFQKVHNSYGERKRLRFLSEIL